MSSMPDWKRLGDYVITRRTHLKYKTRQQLSDATSISTRILGDIETGRREGRFDRTTIARLEKALLWTSGSVKQIAEGGEPGLLTSATDDAGASDTARLSMSRDELIVSIMERDDITDEQKTEIAGILIAQREAAERAREDSARRLVDMFRRQPGS